MIFEKIYDLENLHAAWNRVRANRPGPGIDRVRWEDFEANLAHYLLILQKQLREEAYKPLPVAVFNEPKPTGQARTIGISSMRDKVVQQATLLAIGPHFEKYFLPCCYAYRPGVSALSAVKRAGQCIAQGKLWLLKMDVEKFFDNMDHSIMLELISQVIDEKPIIRLLSRLLKAKIFKEMGLFDNLVGSQQGSRLSPLLSNIYLYPLDKELWSRYKEGYLRYSDDLAVFAEDKNNLEEARELIQECLSKIKLATNHRKTSISHVSTGVVYLGYFMDAKGKGPAQKSVAGLEARLAEYDKIRRTDNALEKLNSAIITIRGWYNYYKTIKPIKPGNIISLLALVQLAREFGEMNFARELIKESKNYAHNHPEICFQLGELYAAFGMPNQAMREYARALEIEPSMEAAKDKVRKLQEGEENVHQAIERIQLLLHHNPHYREGYQKLADLYSELGLYGFAEKAHQKALEIDDEAETEKDVAAPRVYLVKSQADNDFDYHPVDLDTFVGVFSGRREAHAKQWVDDRGRWGFARVERPLKTKDAYAHLKGELTLAVYPVTARDTVNFIVFDVDTAKRIILESGTDLIADFRNKAHQDILRIKTTCDQLGLALYIEDSGYKGRHGWLFFSEEVPATQAIQAGREIMKKSGGPSEGMIWELFPMGKSDRHQSLIKLPLGINQKNNRRCLFLNADNHPIADQALFLKTIKKNTPTTVMAVLDRTMEENTDGEKVLSGDGGHMSVSPGLARMVNSCKVMKHLTAKAKDTNYLNHYERICLLYTLSFAGEEGCRFLHQIISYCINYDHQYTQRQIERRKDSPISCAKIMENFPELAETLPCDCHFNLPPRSYPSPVLYLLQSEIEGADAEDAISKPDAVSRRIKKAETSPAEAVDKHRVEPLDFEKIFSEETLSTDASKESEDGLPPPESPGLFVSVDELSQGHEEMEGHPHGRDDREVLGVSSTSVQEAPKPEKRIDGGFGGIVLDENKEPQGELAVKQPPNSEPIFTSRVDSQSGQVASRPPQTTPGQESSLPREMSETDAWSLMIEYLKLRHSEEKIRSELHNVSSRLNDLFNHLDTDVLETGLGTIRRLRDSGKSSKWILTTAD